MKKLIAGILVTFSTLSFGGGGYHNPYHHYHRDSRWVGPALGGVLVGIAIARSGEQQPQVIIQQPVPVLQPIPRPIIIPEQQTRIILNNQIYSAYICSVDIIDPITGERRREVGTCLR